MMRQSSLHNHSLTSGIGESITHRHLNTEIFHIPNAKKERCKKKRFLTPFQRVKLKWSKDIEGKLLINFCNEFNAQNHTLHLSYYDVNHTRLNNHLVKAVIQCTLIAIITLILYVFNKIWYEIKAEFIILANFLNSLSTICVITDE